MEKFFIKNRLWLKICVLVENSGASKLAFVEHWLWWTKESVTIAWMRETLVNNDFCTVSFDASNSFWESEWKIEDITLTSHYNDLEDVISWAESQKLYKEKFFLAGHSMWAATTFYYNTNYPDKVSWVFPASLFLWWEFTDCYRRFTLPEFKKNWYVERIGSNWIKRRITKDFRNDVLKYDILENSDNIQNPVLMMVMSWDTWTPLKNHKLVYNKLKTKDKKLVVIEWEGHVFKGEHNNSMKKEFDKFLKQYF
jgi:pimeloyl-ACP methyl ester carboxylesterase